MDESFRDRFIYFKRQLSVRCKDARNDHGKVTYACHVNRKSFQDLLRKGGPQDGCVTTVSTTDRGRRFRIMFDWRGPTLVLRIGTQVARRAASDRRLFVICLRSVAALREIARRFFNMRILARVSIGCLWLSVCLKRYVRRAVSDNATYFITLYR